MTRIAKALLCGALMMSGGCAMLDPAYQEDRAREQLLLESLRTDVLRLRERVDGLQVEQQNLRQDVESLRASQGSRGQAADQRVTALEQQVKTLEGGLQRVRTETVDEISRKMADLLKQQSAGGSRPRVSETGYEHIVKPGETLSAIAAAYKVNVNTIMTANNIKDARNLRAGQKLFIPD